MKEFLSRLNGWQRLFTGFMIFIYVPLALVTVFNAGHVKPLEVKPLLELLSTELLVSLRNEEAILKKPNDPIDWDLATGKKYVRFPDVGGMDPNFQYDLYVSLKVEPKKAIELANGFSEAVKDHILKTILIERSLIALYFLFGGLFVYAFGWTLGWIFKGFKKDLNP